MDIQKEKIRTLVKGMYDIQKLRVATGNRIVASLRPAEVDAIKRRLDDSEHNEDGSADAVQAEMDKVLKKIAEEYTLITNYLVDQYKSKASLQKCIDAFGAELAYVRSRADYEIVESYTYLLNAEKGFASSIKREVEAHPMWEKFFKNIGGCGPLMAAVCIAYLDPYKARHASSFWKYAGLDVVVVDGEAQGRARWHTEEVEYVHDGEVKTKKGLTYNPFLKTKLVGVLGSSFLRARGGSVYGNAYYDYKTRMESRTDKEGKPLRPIVIHRRATRYAVKLFLRDMWVAWRELEGLPVSKPWAEDFGGREPHHSPRNEPVPASERVSRMTLEDFNGVDDSE